MLMQGFNRALEYIAIGDSLTAGVGTPLFEHGFVERYAKFAQEDLSKRIHLFKFAHSGATSKEILSMLSQRCTEKAVKQADLITITAGGNDLIQSAKEYLQTENKEILVDSLKSSIHTISSIVKRVDELVTDCEGPFIIRIANLYNPFPPINIADQWVRTFNNHLKQAATSPNVKIVDLYSVFKGKEDLLLSRDGIHPNTRGYTLIVEAFRNYDYRPLSQFDD
jgi:lysophospholipase L1-like esterase